MRKTSHLLAAAGMVTLIAFGCAKDVKEPAADNEIPEAVMAKIGSLGFSKTEVQRTEGGYLVEGDIVLTDEYLNQNPTSPNLIIAQEEQYRTFNTVSSTKYPTITVSVSGTVSSAFSKAVDNAIARYNAERLTIKFQRVASGGNIVIRMVNTGQYIASAGFPSNTGAPYSEIKYANKYSAYSDGFMTTVIAHEMGHCIGFRHTDYMNRAYSCGSGGNEGASTVGAVHIAGTPTGPDAASWMLACLSSTTNRPFNSNDKKALSVVY
ncbi:M57 family metalloprotease [Paracnuella aquatica]|uniref:M57 family metalloprotease n=1 Tax=Paracnuella aquatica TaxID=2268757 RepID=UPI000DEF8C06|nr:M57 family metalloprotease [Paracnuella aquatica]RPD45149.1 protease [Paracnuella aquatica]